VVAEVAEVAVAQVLQQDSQHQALVVKLLFPLQMVKMAPTNLATAAAGVGVGEDTMVAMAVKHPAEISVAKQDRLAAVIPTLVSPVIPQTDNQLIRQAVLRIIILKEEQVDSQDLKAL
jgi:hypothetical protein